jgi:hypothetical protein
MLIILIFLFDLEACICRKEYELIFGVVIFLLRCFDKVILISFSLIMLQKKLKLKVKSHRQKRF